MEFNFKPDKNQTRSQSLITTPNKTPHKKKTNNTILVTFN
jgi:hypothetical protein